MRRLTFAPRPGWEERLRAVGFTWYAPTPEHPVPYWGEDVAYAFTPAEIEHISAASQDLTRLILDTTGHAIESGRLAELGIPPFLHAAVRDSWERDDPTVYMRLDVAYDGQDVRLLEVNAQTPTSLIEAAVAQWQWLEDRRTSGDLPHSADQWNTIHEALGAQWAHLIRTRGMGHIHVSAADVDEDIATVTYLRDLAEQAGTSTTYLSVAQLGTSPEADTLLDTLTLPIRHLLWLWPFEFAWDSPDAAFLASTQTRFLEPLWKTVTGSKGLLALLHERFPDHPNLLPATLTPGALGEQVVRKPLYSREGQNVQLPGQPVTGGDYANLPVVEQAYTHLPTFDAPDGKRYPVLGIWIAGDEVCGLGIREGRNRVTDNRATFVPHVIVED